MRAAAIKILLVQGGLGDSVGPLLERHGYRVMWAQTAKQALERVTSEKPALVIIDAPSLIANAERLCQDVKRHLSLTTYSMLPLHYYPMV